MKPIVILITFIAFSLVGSLRAGELNELINHYAALAKTQDALFDGFDVGRGKSLYITKSLDGKKDTPSCTTCHTNDPTKAGETRAGKTIDPMAASASPQRYQSLKKAEKWFRRNCKSVLGRECTVTEKGDFLTYMKNS
ncbi:MAG: DUF1924 domain-containing protein [Gimesia sp.]|jgi:cytochrome c peroxidase|nr:DUF1924 domain-containing protein [Gimesia sp.]